MTAIVQTQTDFKIDGHGYYRSFKLSLNLQLFQYSDPDPPFMINGIGVFAFSATKEPYKWWIGANDIWDRDKMELIGPYDSADQAIVMIKLLGKPRWG
jgi:hypothetical protein